MRLHLSSDCITINISEYSPYFLHVNQTLSQKFTKSFWVNDTLINFSTPKEAKKRKEFLTSLYYTCARASQTQNLAFLQKLVAMYDKPIKVVKKVVKKMIIHQPYTLDKYYKILEVSQTESLQTIRKKYLCLAKIYHPDHQDTSSVEKFQQIQEAYETIKEQKRKKIAA